MRSTKHLACISELVESERGKLLKWASYKQDEIVNRKREEERRKEEQKRKEEQQAKELEATRKAAREEKERHKRGILIFY